MAAIAPFTLVQCDDENGVKPLLVGSVPASYAIGSLDGETLVGIPINASALVNVKQYGAVGDGVTDDTVAIQAALNALMALPHGGQMNFPLGTYKITHTLTFVGDYVHNYELIGESCGQSPGATLKWAGPAGATMLNCWGLNYTKFRSLGFDGGAGSLIYGRYSVPQTPVIGAGCCLWLHTNQHNNASFAGITPSAACSNLFFDECTFTGVIGGLYPLVAIGDSALSPGCVSVDANSNYTIYAQGSITVGGGTVTCTPSGTSLTFSTAVTYPDGSLIQFTNQANVWYTISGNINNSTSGTITASYTGTAGASTFALVQGKGDNCVDSTPTSTPLATNVSSGTTIVATDGSQLTKNRAMILGAPGKTPWYGAISNIVGNTITAADQNGGGVNQSFLASNAVIYNVYPAAASIALPTSNTTVVLLDGAISNQELAGIQFARCFFNGGGYDTTGVNPNQHTYACVAVYSGANTEQFSFEQQCGFNSSVYGVYSPYSPNNEWIFDNCQWGGGSFSAAGICLGGGANILVGGISLGTSHATLRCNACGNEGTIGYGYFVCHNGGVTEIAHSEVLNQCVGNPFNCGILALAQLEIHHSLLHGAYGKGASAQPMAIQVGSSGQVEIHHCIIALEQYQVSLYTSAGSDLMGQKYGSTAHPGTNLTHSWDAQATFQQYTQLGTNSVRLYQNYGADGNGTAIQLPDVGSLSPPMIWNAGMMNQANGPAIVELYRAQPRTTTTCYDVDYTQIKNAGAAGTTLYLGQMQSRILVRSILVEVSTTFSPATTLDIGDDGNAGADLTSIVSAASLPAGPNGFLYYDYAAGTISNTFLVNNWPAQNRLTIAGHWTGTLTAGHMRIYVTTELMHS